LSPWIGTGRPNYHSRQTFDREARTRIRRGKAEISASHIAPPPGWWVLGQNIDRIRLATAMVEKWRSWTGYELAAHNRPHWALVSIVLLSAGEHRKSRVGPGQVGVPAPDKSVVGAD